MKRKELSDHKFKRLCKQLRKAPPGPPADLAKERKTWLARAKKELGDA